MESSSKYFWSECQRWKRILKCFRSILGFYCLKVTSWHISLLLIPNKFYQIFNNSRIWFFMRRQKKFMENTYYEKKLHILFSQIFARRLLLQVHFFSVIFLNIEKGILAYKMWKWSRHVQRKAGLQSWVLSWNWHPLLRFFFCFGKLEFF